jgi:hypothetical protein
VIEVSPPQSERKASPKGRFQITHRIALSIAVLPESEAPIIAFTPGTNSSSVDSCDWKFLNSNLVNMVTFYVVAFQ